MHGCYKTRRTTIATTALWLLIAPMVACAGTVELRRHAAVGTEAITLADVATLVGSDAKGYADTVVNHLPPGQAGATVTLSQVRQTLSKAGVNWGSLSLCGYQKCQVHRLKVQPGHRGTIADHAKPSAGSMDVGGALTLGDRVCAMIGKLAGAPADRLRIVFNDHDSKLLADPAFGMRVSFEPMASSAVGRVPVVVREFSSNDDLAKSFAVTATVSEKIKAVVATEKINPGDLFTSANTTVKTVWLNRDRGQVETDLGDVRGQAASSILRQGDLVTADLVKAPRLVKRGQMMTVRCISGALVIRTNVRAEQDGGKGDVIKARNEVSHQTLMVTVTGPRQGMIKVGGDDDGTGATPAKGAR